MANRCIDCRHDNGSCAGLSRKGSHKNCFEPKVTTNADRLRAMTDEQWLDWARRQMHCGFEHFPCDVVCRGWCDAASGAECERIIMRWLKQPAKE